MKIISFSIVTAKHDGILESIILLSMDNDSDMIVLISNQQAIINYYLSLLSENKKKVKSVLLKKESFLDNSFYFLPDKLFPNENNNYSIFNPETGENKTFFPIKMLIKEFLMPKEINHYISPELDIKKLNNLSDNFLDFIENIFCGKSTIEFSNNEKRKNESDLDSLLLKEFKFYSDKKNWNGFLKDHEYAFLHSLVDKIIKEINVFFQCTPKLNSKELKEPKEIKGFPAIYKYLSVIHFIAGDLAEKKKLYSINFLHLVRALELYIEGHLIKNKQARFDRKGFLSFINKDKENVKRLGAGAKLDLMRNQLQKENNILKYIDDVELFIKLRNKFYLTHGDIRICSNGIEKFKKLLIIFISELDRHNFQETFLWNDIYKEMKKTFLLKKEDIIYNILIEKNNINITNHNII